MLSIYKHSHFLPNAFGHGGDKRTAQIEHLLAAAGMVVNKAELNYMIATGSKLSFYLSGLLHHTTFHTGNKSKYAIGRYKAIFEQFVKQQKPDLFIWESTIAYHLLLAEVLHKYNIPVVALPHNLESLVEGSASVFSGKLSPNWLFEEMDYLKRCTKVFTISREENWLLANYGINSAFLPYYPSPEAASFLLNIRREKESGMNSIKQDHQNILLLGTFHNSPTVAGFLQLLQHLKTIRGIKINIAGFGSEKFGDQFSGDNISVMGSVTNETLAKLIINSDCAVIHQQPSGGALTRIPELLLAGLPVIANTHAARSCEKTPGLHVFDSYEELTRILVSRNYVNPAVIEKPAEEQAFINYVKNLIGS